MASCFEDQVVPKGNNESRGQIVNWESQAQCVQTHQLLSSSEDWKFCEKTNNEHYSS